MAVEGYRMKRPAQQRIGSRKVVLIVDQRSISLQEQDMKAIDSNQQSPSFLLFIFQERNDIIHLLGGSHVACWGRARESAA
jgi:hypothetical protein